MSGGFDHLIAEAEKQTRDLLVEIAAKQARIHELEHLLKLSAIRERNYGARFVQLEKLLVPATTLATWRAGVGDDSVEVSQLAQILTVRGALALEQLRDIVEDLDKAGAL